ncbi:MAG: SLBB domain-containing protein [Bacteroidetes bacterium]|nr:SLBB domain-containing protein [Bacteroidota bacterium]
MKRGSVAVYGAVVVILAVLVLPSQSASAQMIGRVEQTESNAPDYFYYVQPGTRTIQVHMIGSVMSPGLYEVNDGTTLGQLIALSGGPQLGARQRRNKREVSIRLYRPSTDSAVPLFESELEDGALYTNSYPALQEGDVVRVDVIERTGFSWRDALQIVTATASAYIIFDRANR